MRGLYRRLVSWGPKLQERASRHSQYGQGQAIGRGKVLRWGFGFGQRKWRVSFFCWLMPLKFCIPEVAQGWEGDVDNAVDIVVVAFLGPGLFPGAWAISWTDTPHACS